MNLFEMLAPLAQAAGFTAAHSLWQIALIWLVFKALETCLDRRNQAVYLLAMVAMLASALWAAATFATIFRQATLAAQAVPLTENLSTEMVLSREGAEHFFENTAVTPFWESTQMWIENHAALIGWAWLMCAGLLWMRLVGGWWLAQRLRRREVSLAAEAFQNLCDGWAKHLKISAKVQLLESPHITEPLTLGSWKPVVLFPAGLLLQLSPAQVEALLLHELAHIRRHDYLLNLFQLGLEACFFYHPLFWLLSREARSRREFCCDEVVLRHTSNPILYAKTLTDLQLSILHPSTPFVMNATGKSRFAQRILYIAGITPSCAARPNWLLTLLLPLAFGLSSWWPSAQTLPSQPSLTPSEMLAADTLPPQTAVQPNLEIARPQPDARSEAKPTPQSTMPESTPAPSPNVVALEVVKMNVFYIGVDNPLRVAVAGVPTSELRVQLVGSGTIDGGEGYYNVRVTQPGEVAVRVVRQIGDRVEPVAYQKYRVKRIPDPLPRVDNTYKGGTISPEEMQQTKGVTMLMNFDLDANCEVLGFQFTYLPKMEDPITRDNVGGDWDASVQEWVKKAKSGDTFFIDGIQVKCPGDGVPRNLGGIAFKIK